MTVLLIGGTGNLSSGVLAQLLANGYNVDCITRGSNKNAEREAEKNGAHFIHFSSFSSPTPEELELLSSQYDFVVDFTSYTAADIKAKINLLYKYVKQAYIYISSTAFYKRSSAHSIMWREDNVKICHEWDYAANKYAAEQTFSLMSNQLPFRTIVIRLGHTIGTSIPVYLGNPGHSFIDHVTSGLPIPIIGTIDHPWSLATSNGLALVIRDLFIRISSLPDNLVFHFSEIVTSWVELYSILCSELGMPLQEKTVDLKIATEIAPRWIPSILYHKMHRDLYDLSLMESFLPRPPTPLVEDVVRSSLLATQSSPREKNYKLDRNQLKMLIDSPNLH